MKRYYIDDEEATQEDFNTQLEDLANNIAEESYDDILNANDDVIIGNLRYDVAHVLKEVDPVAYRCGLTDYADSLLSDFQYDLDCSGVCYAGIVKFEVREDEDTKKESE